MSKRFGSSVPVTAEKSSSKRRMDSMISGSDSFSDPYDVSELGVLAPAPLTYVSPSSLEVGPLLSMKEDDLIQWRKDYLLPSSVFLRVPGSSERLSICRPGEVAVYEAFFESGFRGTIPSLIVDLCDFFRISLSQLNPAAWRILTAIQNLSDVKCLPLDVDEVLFASHFALLNGGEGRFHLRPRSGLPIVEELPKSDRNGLSFAKRWPKRYVFMTLPGSTTVEPRWLRGEFLSLMLTISLHFLDLTGDFLRRWHCRRGPMEAFNRENEAISARKGVATSVASGNDVMITGSSRKMVIKSEAVSSSQVRRPRGRMGTRLYPRSFDTEHVVGGSYEVLKDLKARLFPQESALLLDGDPAEVILMLQEKLLQVASLLHHLEARSQEGDVSSLKEEAKELARQLSEEKSRRIAQGMELCDLQARIKAMEGTVESSSSEALELSCRNQELEEVIEKQETETKASQDMR
ncbi:unnamed protein product, partial [Eruca vesicaria subsp. sativa]|nr:unnamed protein product [Eruca vesicaria subsp. sativa]